MSISRAGLTQIVGKPIGPIGYGLMSLTFPSVFGSMEHEVAAKAMKTALNQGANLWNGGIHYGTPTANSLHLLRYYFKKYPEDADKVVLSIKGALDKHQPIGTRDGIRASVEGALEVLEGTKKIDVFEMARVDPNTPIETSVKALAELVEEGKIGGIGLSEVSAKTIRRAHAVHPIAAVEIELSLFTPDPLNNGIMDACHELSIPVVAYSPVGRGWLSGKFRTADDLPKDPFRSTFDRFKPENFEQNLKLVEAVESLAKRKHLTSSQVAIAWVTRQGAIPIPGSTNIDRIALNSKLETLSDEDMAELQNIMDKFPVGGGRYGKAHEKLLNA